MINFSYFHVGFGLATLAIALIFLAKQRRSFWYLFFFSVLWIYLLLVLSAIVFPIFPLTEIDRDTFRLSLNLIPLYFGTCDMPKLCFRSIVDNILITIPFGLGISFIANLRWRDFIWLSLLVGFGFEVLQLIIALLFRSPFRVVDVNDAILNALGVWIGYLLFRGFGSFYLFAIKKLKMKHISLFAYVYEVFRQSQ